MKIFKEELERRKEERRQKRSSTWSGLLFKVAILILLILLIRYIISPGGKRFGNYWREAFQIANQESNN